MLNNRKSEVAVSDFTDTELEFLPAALEIEHSPPPRWSRLILWTLLALLSSTITWAIWAEIDIVVSAQGKIVPNGNVKIIQPLETGVAKKIFVSEGQIVNKGDKLIALDSTHNDSEVGKISNELSSFSQEYHRKSSLLNKISHSKNEKMDINVGLLNKQQIEILDSEWLKFSAKNESILSEIRKLVAEKKP